MESSQSTPQPQVVIGRPKSWGWAFGAWVIFLIIAAAGLPWLWGKIPELAVAVAVFFAAGAIPMLGGPRRTSARGFLAVPVAFAAVAGCLSLPSITTLWTAEEVPFEVIERDQSWCDVREISGDREARISCPNGWDSEPGDRVDMLIDGLWQSEPHEARRFRDAWSWVPPVALVGWVGGFGLRAWGVADARKAGSQGHDPGQG